MFYTEPNTQASTITVSGFDNSFIRFAWTRGTGDGVIVVVRQDNAVDFVPADGNEYD